MICHNDTPRGLRTYSGTLISEGKPHTTPQPPVTGSPGWKLDDRMAVLVGVHLRADEGNLSKVHAMSTGRRSTWPGVRRYRVISRYRPRSLSAMIGGWTGAGTGTWPSGDRRTGR